MDEMLTAQALQSLAQGFSIFHSTQGTVPPGRSVSFSLNPQALDVQLPVLLDAPVTATFLTKSVRFADALLPGPDRPLEAYLRDAQTVLGGQPIADVQIPLPGPSLTGAVPPTTQINVAEATAIALAEAIGVGISTVSGTVQPPQVTLPQVAMPTVTVPQPTQTVQSTPLAGATATEVAPLKLNAAAPKADDLLSGVPGLLGRVLATVPMLVKVPVEVTVAWSLVDVETMQPARSEQVTIDGAGTFEVRLTFAPLFTEMTDLTTPPVRRFRLIASVTVAAGSQRVTRSLPPVELAVPQIAVPTIAILYQGVDYSGYALVFVPSTSPLDPITPQQSVQRALDLLRQAIAPLAGTHPDAAFFLGNLGSYLADAQSVVLVKGDSIPNLKAIAFRGYDFWKDFLNAEGPRAEDVLNSAIFLGVPGRQLHGYNARNLDPVQGHFVLTTDAKMIVKVRDLSASDTFTPLNQQQNVLTVPSGRAQVDPVPAGSRDPEPHPIRVFGGELSSLEFGQTQP